MSLSAPMTISADALLPRRPVAQPTREWVETFACFGSTCSVIVSGSGPAGSAAEATVRARRRLLDWHGRFSRFESRSELSRLNRSPRETVRVSAAMAGFVEAAIAAAALTDGLVDPTLIGEIERAGYGRHFERSSLTLREALTRVPERRPGAPSRARRWRRVKVDAGTVRRPPGLRLDSGGVAKGLFGDWLATVLAGHESFAVDAAGDLRFGGSGQLVRPVRVASPFDDSLLHVFELRRGAAATSGIGRRSWIGSDGRPAHHLLDPATGRPAFTGVVQVTALAPRALEAEARAKAALLSGPGAAADWLPYGGVIVVDDGSFDVIAADQQLARRVGR